MTVIYLGGPINGCSDQEANEWRQMVIQHPLLKGGFTFIDPMARDYRGRELDPGIAQQIVEGDISDITASDVGLFNCPTPSVGTSMEIRLMKAEQHKPVCVIHPENRAPSPWLIYHADTIFPSAERAVMWIASIFGSNGESR